jgi:HemY protein
MTRLVVLLAVAIALGALAVWFADNPGLVLVQWQGREVRSSVGIALLALLAVLVVATALAGLVGALARTPGRWGAARRRSRQERGWQALASGLIAAAAGDQGAARQHARQAERLLDRQPATLLLTAQSAQLAGDDETAHTRFRAMLGLPQTELLGLRGLLGQAARLGDPEEALDLARRAFRQNPSVPWTGTTLFELLTRRERWAEALPLVAALEVNGQIDGDTARRHRAALETLIARERLAASAFAPALEAGRRAFRLMPAFAPAAVAAARAAVEAGRAGEAGRTLERAWEIRPHPELARAYAELAPAEQAAARLKRFDRLRRRHPDHLETLLTLAELALAAGDARQAKGLLERATARGDATARACRLMAEAERALGSPPEQVESWLVKAGEARRDPAWVCEDTGEVLPAWQPFGRSGRFNRIAWTTPPDVAPMLAQRPGPPVLVTVAPAAA